MRRKYAPLVEASPQGSVQPAVMEDFLGQSQSGYILLLFEDHSVSSYRDDEDESHTQSLNTTTSAINTSIASNNSTAVPQTTAKPVRTMSSTTRSNSILARSASGSLSGHLERRKLNHDVLSEHCGPTVPSGDEDLRSMMRSEKDDSNRDRKSHSRRSGYFAPSSNASVRSDVFSVRVPSGDNSEFEQTSESDDDEDVYDEEIHYESGSENDVRSYDRESDNESENDERSYDRESHNESENDERSYDRESDNESENDERSYEEELDDNSEPSSARGTNSQASPVGDESDVSDVESVAVSSGEWSESLDDGIHGKDPDSSTIGDTDDPPGQLSYREQDWGQSSDVQSVAVSSGGGSESAPRSVGESFDGPGRFEEGSADGSIHEEDPKSSTAGETEEDDDPPGHEQDWGTSSDVESVPVSSEETSERAPQSDRESFDASSRYIQDERADSDRNEEEDDIHQEGPESSITGDSDSVNDPPAQLSYREQDWGASTDVESVAVSSEEGSEWVPRSDAGSYDGSRSHTAIDSDGDTNRSDYEDDDRSLSRRSDDDNVDAAPEQQSDYEDDGDATSDVESAAVSSEEGSESSPRRDVESDHGSSSYQRDEMYATSMDEDDVASKEEPESVRTRYTETSDIVFEQQSSSDDDKGTFRDVESVAVSEEGSGSLSRRDSDSRRYDEDERADSSAHEDDVVSDEESESIPASDRLDVASEHIAHSDDESAASSDEENSEERSGWSTRSDGDSRQYDDEERVDSSADEDEVVSDEGSESVPGSDTERSDAPLEELSYEEDDPGGSSQERSVATSSRAEWESSPRGGASLDESSPTSDGESVGGSRSYVEDGRTDSEFDEDDVVSDEGSESVSESYAERLSVGSGKQSHNEDDRSVSGELESVSASAEEASGSTRPGEMKSPDGSRSDERELSFDSDLDENEVEYGKSQESVGTSDEEHRLAKARSGRRLGDTDLEGSDFGGESSRGSGDAPLEKGSQNTLAESDLKSVDTSSGDPSNDEEEDRSSSHEQDMSESWNQIHRNHRDKFFDKNSPRSTIVDYHQESVQEQLRALRRIVLGKDDPQVERNTRQKSAQPERDAFYDVEEFPLALESSASKDSDEDEYPTAKSPDVDETVLSNRTKTEKPMTTTRTKGSDTSKVDDASQVVLLPKKKCTSKGKSGRLTHQASITKEMVPSEELNEDDENHYTGSPHLLMTTEQPMSTKKKEESDSPKPTKAPLSSSSKVKKKTSKEKKFGSTRKSSASSDEGEGSEVVTIPAKPDAGKPVSSRLKKQSDGSKATNLPQTTKTAAKKTKQKFVDQDTSQGATNEPYQAADRRGKPEDISAEVHDRDIELEGLKWQGYENEKRRRQEEGNSDSERFKNSFSGWTKDEQTAYETWNEHAGSLPSAGDERVASRRTNGSKNPKANHVEHPDKLRGRSSSSFESFDSHRSRSSSRSIERLVRAEGRPLQSLRKSSHSSSRATSDDGSAVSSDDEDADNRRRDDLPSQEVAHSDNPDKLRGRSNSMESSDSRRSRSKSIERVAKAAGRSFKNLRRSWRGSNRPAHDVHSVGSSDIPESGTVTPQDVTDSRTMKSADEKESGSWLRWSMRKKGKTGNQSPNDTLFREDDRTPVRSSYLKSHGANENIGRPQTVAEQREERMRLYLLDQRLRSTVLIQSALRGYVVRKRLGIVFAPKQSVDDGSPDDKPDEVSMDTIGQAPSFRHDTRKDPVGDVARTVSRKVIPNSPERSSRRTVGFSSGQRRGRFEDARSVSDQRDARRKAYLLDQQRRSATIIQAALRGYIQRKKLGIDFRQDIDEPNKQVDQGDSMDEKYVENGRTSHSKKSSKKKVKNLFSYLKPTKIISKAKQKESPNVQKFDSSLYLQHRMYKEEQATMTKSLEEVRNDRRRLYLLNLQRREAIKIQAATRGFLARKEIFPSRYKKKKKKMKKNLAMVKAAAKTIHENSEPAINLQTAEADSRPGAFDRSSYLIERLQRDEYQRQTKTIAEIRTERHEIYVRDLQRREAVKIQAAMRGFMTRKRYPGYSQATRGDETPGKKTSKWKRVKRFLGGSSSGRKESQVDSEKNYEDFDPHAADDQLLSNDYLGLEDATRNHRTVLLEVEKTPERAVHLQAYTESWRHWNGRKQRKSSGALDDLATRRAQDAVEELRIKAELMACKRATRQSAEQSVPEKSRSSMTSKAVRMLRKNPISKKKKKENLKKAQKKLDKEQEKLNKKRDKLNKALEKQHGDPGTSNESRPGALTEGKRATSEDSGLATAKATRRAASTDSKRDRSRESGPSTSLQSTEAVPRESRKATTPENGTAIKRRPASSMEGKRATSRKSGTATSRGAAPATSREGGTAASREGGTPAAQETTAATTTKERRKVRTNTDSEIKRQPTPSQVSEQSEMTVELPVITRKTARMPQRVRSRDDIVKKEASSEYWEEIILVPASPKKESSERMKDIQPVILTSNPIKEHTGLTHSTDIGDGYWLPQIGTEEIRTYRIPNYLSGDVHYQKYYKQKAGKVTTIPYWECVRSNLMAADDDDKGLTLTMNPSMPSVDEEEPIIREESVKIEDDCWLPPDDPRAWTKRSIPMGDSHIDDEPTEDSWVPLPSRTSHIQGPRRLDFAGQLTSPTPTKEESWAPHLPSPSQRAKTSLDKQQTREASPLKKKGRRGGPPSGGPPLAFARGATRLSSIVKSAPPLPPPPLSSSTMEVPMGNADDDGAEPNAVIQPKSPSQAVKDYRRQQICFFIIFLLLIGAGATCAHFFWEDAPWK